MSQVIYIVLVFPFHSGFSFQIRQQHLNTNQLQQRENNTTVTTEGSVIDDKTSFGDHVKQHISEMGHTNRGDISCDSNNTKPQESEGCSAHRSSTSSTTNNMFRDIPDLLGDQSVQAGSSLELYNSQQLNHSNCGKKTSIGSDLEWFDTIQTGTRGINISPISKMAENTTIKLQTDVLPGLEATSSEFSKSTINSKAAKQPTEKISRETQGHNEDEVVTERVSKKWHKLNKKSMKSTTEGPSITELCGHGDPSEKGNISSTGPLHSTPARGRKRPLAHVDPEKGTEEVQDPELQAKLAQLAKFSFKHKTKLLHSPRIENELTAASGNNDREGTVGADPKQRPAPTKKLRRLLEVSVSSDIASSVRQEKSSGAATTAVTLEKDAPIVPHAGPSSVLVNEENEQTEASHNRKVSSSTLAKLAKFSFTSPSEDKIADPSGVIPEHENPLSSRNLGAGGKRKCFQLEPLTNNTIGTKSLFSSTDFDDETLDLDWNIEIKGKN